MPNDFKDEDDRRQANRDTLEQVRSCLAEALSELDTLDCDAAATLAAGLRAMFAERVTTRERTLVPGLESHGSIFGRLSTTAKVVTFDALTAVDDALERGGKAWDANEEYRAAVLMQTVEVR